MIEVVIAIAIFSVLGLGCYKVVHGLALARDTMTQNAEAMRRLSKAINTINMDFSQLTPRKVLDENGHSIPSLDTHGDYAVEFSRIGVPNPLMVKRAQVSRVAYAFKEEIDKSELKQYKDDTVMLDMIGDGKRGYLLRYVWPVMDRGNDEKPAMKIVLAGVKSFEIKFMDDKKGWNEEWPVGSKDNQSLNVLPYVIHLEINTDKYGIVERSFVVREFPPPLTSE